jgi:hypothetical protein
MAVKTNKTVLYHISKCGGTWAAEALRRVGLPYSRCKENKEKLNELGNEFGLRRKHGIPVFMLPEEVKGLFSVCFVRHPLSWYKSVWSYKREPVSRGKFPPDKYWVPDYEEFVKNMLFVFPEGFVTKLFQYYVGEHADQIDFIGRQEYLADDLVTALTLAGETFDEHLLRARGWRNVSKKSDAVLSDETYNRVLEVEKWVVDNFYG